MNELTSMEMARKAFRELGRLVNLNGRRLVRKEWMMRARVHTPDPHNQARRAPMASRRDRRARILELRREAKRRNKNLSKATLQQQFFFRPVIGYLGVLPEGAASHDDVIAAMKAKR